MCFVDYYTSKNFEEGPIYKPNCKGAVVESRTCAILCRGGSIRGEGVRWTLRAGHDSWFTSWMVRLQANRADESVPFSPRYTFYMEKKELGRDFKTKHFEDTVIVLFVRPLMSRLSTFG